MSKKWPLVVEAQELRDRLGEKNLLVIDVSIPQVYREGHIPGAIHLSYPSILLAHDNVDCDIPSDEVLSASLSGIGLLPQHHVVAYDSQYNPMASRFLWTLEEIGHQSFSIMNGGWHAWRNTGLPVDTRPRILVESKYQAKQTGKANATCEYIEKKLGDPNVVILDTRMLEEFTNELLMTDRGGNIPGAVHFDWERAINPDDHFRFLDDNIIMKYLSEIGVVPEKEIIIYCQTHFRSAHTYIVLKHLGFKNIRGYAAGYSEWGNASLTPIENEIFEEEEWA